MNDFLATFIQKQTEIIEEEIKQIIERHLGRELILPNDLELIHSSYELELNKEGFHLEYKVYYLGRFHDVRKCIGNFKINGNLGGL